MRIAISSVTLDSTSRSTNVARALKLIETAAGGEPAPGLVVVPPGCDHVRERRHVFTRAMSEMYSASMSVKAREWGVLLAYGQRRYSETGTEDVAVFLDADGDERLVIGADALPDHAAETVFGPIVVCMRSDAGKRESADGAWPAAALTLVLGQPAGDSAVAAQDRALCERIAGVGSRTACVVRASTAANGGADCVSCSDRTVLGEPCEVSGGYIVTGDVVMGSCINTTKHVGS